MSKRWAFVSLALFTGLAVVRCGSSNVLPPIEGGDAGSGGSGSSSGGPVKYDANQPDTNPPPPPDTGTPGISIGTSKLDFGQVPCGGNGSDQFIEVTNSGTSQLDVSFNMLQGGQYFTASFSAASGDGGGPVTTVTLPPGQKTTVRVTPNQMPQVADTTANHFADVLAFSTNPVVKGLGPDALNVSLVETAKGAILKWAASSIPFGNAPLNVGTPKTFTVQDVGNDSATVYFQTSPSPGPFSVVNGGPVAVTAGKSTDDTLTFTPIDTSQQSATVTMTADSNTVLCAPLPSPLQTSGQGTSGLPLVTPTELKFGPNSDGMVNCGTQAPALGVTVKNIGTAAFDWTASFTQGGSNYGLVKKSGTIQPNSQDTVFVQPVPIPQNSAVTPGLYNGILQIVTTAQGDTPHTIQLDQTAQGAILQSTFGGGTLSFPDTPDGQTSASTFSVQNLGNVSADVNFNLAAGAFALSLPNNQAFPVTIGPQNNIAVTASFSPSAIQPYSQVATLTATTSAFCSPISAIQNMTLKGNGTKPPPLGLSLSRTSIDFGQVPCGHSANAISVAINNTGTMPFDWAATFRNGQTSQFQITPSSGSILAGGSQTVQVSMTGVPQVGNTATDFYGDSLHVVATANNGTASVDTPVHLTGYGAILRFAPTAIDFGSVPLNKSATSGFNIVNAGNAAAEVDLQVANGNGSTSTITRAPIGLITVNGASSSPLTATFTAKDLNPQTGSFTMASATSTNSFCADIPSALTLSGTGGSGTVGISTTNVTFSTDPVNNPGYVNCGTQAQPATVTLTNTGTLAYNATIALTSGAANYTLGPSPAGNGSVTLPVPAGSQATFSITPKQIPTTSSVSANLYGGSITVTTDAPNDTPHVISLNQTAYGAIMTWSLPATFDFGNQTVGVSAKAGISVTNNGNAPASVSFSNGVTAFSLASPGIVGPSSTKSSTLSFLPSAAQPYTDTATMTVQSTATCGALPAGSTIKGTGVNPAAPVVSVQQSITFGNVPCGDPTQHQVAFAVKNTGTNPFTLSAALLNPQDTRFTVTPTSKAPVTVSSGGQVSVTVTLPKMDQYASITPDALGDTVVLTASNAGGTSTSNVAIHITASGAILSYAPTGLNFGVEPVNSSTKLPFSVTNSGNLSFEANLAFDSSSAGTFSRSPLGFVTVAGGATSALNATFAPGSSDATTETANLVMASSGNANNVLCEPLPAGLSMVGTGSTSTTIVSPATIDFGQTNCGSQAGNQSISITNGANSAISWTASVISGSAYYTLSSSGGSVAANSNSSFQVIPNAIPSTSAVTDNLYGGTIKVVSGPNNDVQLINLTQTARGVILTASGNGATNFTSLNFGSVSVNQTATTQFTLTNSGNADLTYAQGTSGITLANTNSVFAVNPNPAQGQTAQSLAFGLSAHQSQIVAMTFTPTAVQSYNDSAQYTIQLPANTVLCQSAPPNFTIAGSGNTGVGVSPTNLNFGYVQCKSAPPTGQSVTITNKGNAATWTGTFGRGTQNLPSYYSLSDSSGNPIAAGQAQTLPAGSSVTIVVTPTQITTPASTSSDAFSDTLTITTTAAGDSSHIVSLHETAQGAFLVVSPTSIDNTSIGAGTTAFNSFTVSNSGNLAATYALDVFIQNGDNGSPNPYPQHPNICSSYNASSPYDQPPPSWNASIVLPEMCINSTGANIFATQTQTITLESTAYNAVPDAGAYVQAIGYMLLTPDANAVLCSDPVPQIPIKFDP